MAESLSIEITINKYLLSRTKQILNAVQPILSEQMFKKTLHLPDDTPVRISVESQNGYAKTITLEEWRILFIAAYQDCREDIPNAK